MLHIKETIVVEGKFDKEQLKKVTDAPVICTGGFTLYTDKTIMRSICAMAKKTGIIVLTDSDSAGFRIRSYIKQCVGKDGSVKHAYIPSVKGKEHRKEKAGKEGLLGVEGISEKQLEDILLNVTEVTEGRNFDGTAVTKAMLFEDGLSGGKDSSQKRKRLAQCLGLPVRISANAMLEVINGAIGYDGYKRALSKVEHGEL